MAAAVRVRRAAAVTVVAGVAARAARVKAYSGGLGYATDAAGTMALLEKAATWAVEAAEARRAEAAAAAQAWAVSA